MQILNIFSELIALNLHQKLPIQNVIFFYKYYFKFNAKLCFCFFVSKKIKNKLFLGKNSIILTTLLSLYPYFFIKIDPFEKS